VHRWRVGFTNAPRAFDAVLPAATRPAEYDAESGRRRSGREGAEPTAGRQRFSVISDAEQAARDLLGAVKEIVERATDV